MTGNHVFGAGKTVSTPDQGKILKAKKKTDIDTAVEAESK